MYPSRRKKFSLSTEADVADGKLRLNVSNKIVANGNDRIRGDRVTIGDRVNTRQRGSVAILPRPCFQTVERIRDALTRGKSELQNRKIILCNASTP